ncbi:hypothetical protein CEXT_267211, partial [Caerostris extrusa]
LRIAKRHLIAFDTEEVKGFPFQERFPFIFRLNLFPNKSGFSWDEQITVDEE